MSSPNTGLLTDNARPEYQAFHTYAVLTENERQLKRELKEVQRHMEALEPQLREYLGAEGFQRVRVGGYTIYLRREIWPRHKEGYTSLDVCAVLKQVGMGGFVREQVELQKLAAHVRELAEAHEDELEDGQALSEFLPAPLASVLHVEPTLAICAMKTDR